MVHAGHGWEEGPGTQRGGRSATRSLLSDVNQGSFLLLISFKIQFEL